jgi:hypothetical protein
MQVHVISVWLQHPWAGLGDLIRGTMHLCDLSREFQFKLTVDTRFHPMSKYLAVSEHTEQSDYVLQNKDKVHDFVNGDITRMRDVIKNAMNAGQVEPVLILSNLTERMFVPPHYQSAQFIRNLLLPTHEFQSTFNQMCKTHRISKNYSILHFRMGVESLVNHHHHTAKYRHLLNMVDSNIDNNTYIISDSHAFKQFLCQARPHLATQVMMTKPIHLSHSTEKDTELIVDTMFDFFLISNATVIKTYTNYTWVSGFVKWVSCAFGIPLINLNFQKVSHKHNTHDQLQEFTFSKKPITQMRTHLKPMLFIKS